MKAVEEAVSCGCEYDTYIGDECYAAEYGVYGREYFASCRFYFYHRPHTA